MYDAICHAYNSVGRYEPQERTPVHKTSRGLKLRKLFDTSLEKPAERRRKSSIMIRQTTKRVVTATKEKVVLVRPAPTNLNMHIHTDIYCIILYTMCCQNKGL